MKKKKRNKTRYFVINVEVWSGHLTKYNQKAGLRRASYLFSKRKTAEGSIEEIVIILPHIKHDLRISTCAFFVNKSAIVDEEDCRWLRGCIVSKGTAPWITEDIVVKNVYIGYSPEFAQRRRESMDRIWATIPKDMPEHLRLIQFASR